MTIDLTRLTANTQTWAQTASTANVSVPPSDGGPRTLTGMAAAAYLFGQALTTVRYQDTLDGVQLSDCRFQFPPDPAPTSGPDNRQWVSLSEVADALRYKYGVDPLIEFAPGLGVRGYSVPDINRILGLLNREFADSFNIALPVISTAVDDLTRAAFVLENAAASISSTNTTEDSVIFSTNPNWATGTPVRVSSPSGGLTNFANNFYVDYFARNLGEGKYSFFNSQAEAVGTATTGRVDLTSAIGSGVTISYSAPSVNATNVSDEWVSFGTDPGWATGTPVRVGGLDAGVDYFVRNIGEGKYSFFTSQAAAAGTTTTGRVDLRTNLGNEQVSVSYVPTIVSTLLNTASTPILAGATETELRQNLTEGGDLYTDRFGAFYLNGVRTQAMDVAVTSRLLVQDNVSAEHKTLMDELAERNNLIAAARTVSSRGLTGLAAALSSLKQQYGFADVLSELTAGQYSDNQAPPAVKSTDVSNDSITFHIDPGWPTGTPVDVNVTGNNLSYGVVYYVRNLGSGSYSFYRRQDTADGTASPMDQLFYGRVNLESSFTQEVSASLPVRSDNRVMTVGSVGNLTEWMPGSSDYTTFTSDGNFDTGTRIRLGTGNTTYLNRNTDYYLRNDGGTYKVMSDLEAARAGNDTYRKFLDTQFSSDQLILMDVVNFNIAPNFAANYAMATADPRWPTGTAVEVDATGGGLDCRHHLLRPKSGWRELQLLQHCGRRCFHGQHERHHFPYQ